MPIVPIQRSMSFQSNPQLELAFDYVRNTHKNIFLTGKAGAELLFDVLSTAYERVSLIVTTNLPFEHWTEVLGSERLTGAALDRLTHRCHILEAKGESYRLRDARRRQRSSNPAE